MILAPSQSATMVQLSPTASTATWVYWCSSSQDMAQPERDPRALVPKEKRGRPAARRR